MGSLLCLITTRYGSFCTAPISSWNFWRDDCLITRVFAGIQKDKIRTCKFARFRYQFVDNISNQISFQFPSYHLILNLRLHQRYYSLSLNNPVIKQDPIVWPMATSVHEFMSVEVCTIQILTPVIFTLPQMSISIKHWLSALKNTFQSVSKNKNVTFCIQQIFSKSISPCKMRQQKQHR